MESLLRNVPRFPIMWCHLPPRIERSWRLSLRKYEIGEMMCGKINMEEFRNFRTIMKFNGDVFGNETSH